MRMLIQSLAPVPMRCRCLNSLWPSDTIWWQRCGSTLAQVMASCLTAPSHYLNHNNMLISYSWYNNEMVQIQMENMPKKYNTHASYKSSTQSDEGTYSLVLQTICIFDITVQQYLITCNFPNQIKQFGWIKYWQVITIVFTCCELFYRSYSITCFNINSAGSVFAQIIIGAIP